MLNSSKVAAFIPTTNVEAAREFFEKRLGLTFLLDDKFALVFDANGTKLRVVKVAQHTPAPFTILGWEVENIRKSLRDLKSAGVVFERYAFLPMDDDGVVTFETGDQVAWFKDPDGNILSIAQHV